MRTKWILEALVFMLLLVPQGARAHLAGTVYSPVYRHISSYDCTGQFAQVPNLSTHPALFECEAIVTEFDYLCANPVGKVNRGNSGPRSIVQLAEAALTNADITDKKKGIASKTMKLPGTVLEAADAACKDRNRNWSAADELVLSAYVTLRSYDCVTDDCSEIAQAFESLLRCTLPEGYDIVDNPPVNGKPVPYDCELIAEAHCDKGDACPIVLSEAQAIGSQDPVDGAGNGAPSAGGCQTAEGASLLGLAAAALLALRRSRR